MRIQAGRRDRLEHLIRNVSRPPLAEERLSILLDGQIAYAFRKRWRSGSTRVVLDPLTFLTRLAALVPRTRKKLVNYFGVFAPAASYRSRVVPLPSTDAPGEVEPQCAHQRPDPPAAPDPEDQKPEGSPGSEPAHQRAAHRPHFRGVPHAPRKRPRRRRRYFF